MNYVSTGKGSKNGGNKIDTNLRVRDVINVQQRSHLDIISIMFLLLYFILLDLAAALIKYHIIIICTFECAYCV